MPLAGRPLSRRDPYRSGHPTEVVEGFEPPVPVKELQFSRLVQSARLCHTTAEDRGLEPLSPFGPPLSRRLQYHSANLPRT